MALKKESRQVTYAEQIGVNRGAGYDALAQVQINKSNTIDSLITTYAQKNLAKMKALGAERAEEAVRNYVPSFSETEIEYKVNGATKKRNIKLIDEPIKPIYLQTKTEIDTWKELSFRKYSQQIEKEMSNIISATQSEATLGRLDGSQFSLLVSQNLQPLLDNLEPDLRESSLLSLQQSIDTAALDVDVKYNAYNITKFNVETLEELTETQDYAMGNLGSLIVSDADYNKTIDDAIETATLALNTKQLSVDSERIVKNRIKVLEGHKKARKFLIDNKLIYAGELTEEQKIEASEVFSKLEIITRKGDPLTQSVEIKRLDGTSITVTKAEVLDWFGGDADSLNTLSNAFSERSQELGTDIQKIVTRLKDENKGMQSIYTRVDNADYTNTDTLRGAYKALVSFRDNKETLPSFDEFMAYTVQDFVDINQFDNAKRTLLKDFFNETGKLPPNIEVVLNQALNLQTATSAEALQNLKYAGVWDFIDTNYSGEDNRLSYVASVMNNNYTLTLEDNTTEGQIRYLQSWATSDKEPLSKSTIASFDRIFGSDGNPNTGIDFIIRDIIENDLANQSESMSIGEKLKSEVTGLITKFGKRIQMDMADTLQDEIMTYSEVVGPDWSYDDMDQNIRDLIYENALEQVRLTGATDPASIEQTIREITAKAIRANKIGTSTFEMGVVNNISPKGVEGYTSLVTNPIERNTRVNLTTLKTAIENRFVSDYPAIQAERKKPELGTDFKLSKTNINGVYKIYIWDKFTARYKPAYTDDNQFLTINVRNIENVIAEDLLKRNDG